VKGQGLICLILLMCLISCDNKSTIEPRQDITFLKIYGSETRNEAVDLIYNDQSQEIIILAKSFENGSSGSRDIMIIKTDLYGNNASYFFTNSTGIDEEPIAMDINGSDIYIAGAVIQEGEKDMMLAQFSLGTNTFLWVNAYGEQNKDETAFSIEIQSSEILLAGSAEDSIDIDNDQNFDVFGLVRNVRIVDMDGNQILESPRKNSGFVKDIKRFNVNVYHSLSQEIDPISGEVNTQIDAGIFDGNFGTGYSPQLEGNDFPVNLIRQDSRILALGFFSNQRNNPQESIGTFLFVAPYDQTNGNIISGSATIIRDSFFETLEIIPVQLLQVESNRYLILGTDNDNTIRLVKFEEGGSNTYNLLWDESFGTKRPGDEAGMVVSYNSEYFFNATITFQSLSDFTKIGLFKTNSSGKLDF